MMWWSPEQDARLRELWGNGLTASRIKELMGLRTRSQVIGRVHRLELAARPTPIKPASELSRANSRKRAKQFKLAFPREAKETVPLQVPVARTIPVKMGPVTKCQWIDGDPKHRDYCFCNKPTLAGYSWCEGHYLRVFQPKIQAAE